MRFFPLETQIELTLQLTSEDPVENEIYDSHICTMVSPQNCIAVLKFSQLSRYAVIARLY